MEKRQVALVIINRYSINHRKIIGGGQGPRAAPPPRSLKYVRFYWDDTCDKAFHTLKSRITSAPILAYPNFSLPFELNTNASSNGTGFALCQTQHGQRRAIAYGGWDLSTAERNYCTTEQEALAIVEGIKKF